MTVKLKDGSFMLKKNKTEYSTWLKSKRWKEIQEHRNKRNILRLSTKNLRNKIVIEENHIKYDS